jgi:response regulator RpfG family c-di-GMP phosphodiesterase
MAAVKSRSLLRKFSIIFVGVALIPFIILFYLYSLYDQNREFIKILDTHFSLILFIVGVISILGFFGMRLTIKKIILLTESVEKSLTDEIDEEAMSELAKEEGEIGELAKSFMHISKLVSIKEQQAKEAKDVVFDVLKNTIDILAAVNNHDNLITLVLETSVDALGANQGALFSTDDGRYILKAWVGRNDAVTAEQVKEEAQVYVDQVRREGKPLFIPAKEKSQLLNKLFIPPFIFSPLIHNDKLFGVLFFCGNSYWDNSSSDHMAIVSNMSHQIAVSFNYAKINKNADQTHFETLAALALAVEARDPYSRGHSSRVGKYAQKIGELMRLPEQDIQTLLNAGMLHDIGKIGINYGVLTKRGKLSTEERYVIRNHPVIGESIVLRLHTYKHLLDPIRHHHELLDGSGYPDGLKRGEISPLSRILSVADLFDTLMENRPYRSGMNFARAKKELNYLVEAGKTDKNLVSILYSTLDKEIIGNIS